MRLERGSQFSRALEESTGRLVDLLLGQYASSSMMLPARVDCATGQILNRRAIVDELGDYLPYLIQAGRLLDRENVETWTLRHVTKGVSRCQTEYGLFDTTRTIDWDGASRYAFRPVLATRNADTINGLVSSYVLTRNGTIRAMVERFFEGVENYFCDDGLVPYLLLPPIGWRLPIGSALAGAYFAEEALIFHRLTGEDRYRSLAERLLFFHVESDYFKRFGLFNLRQYRTSLLWPFLEATFILRGKPPSDSSVIVKDNCYLVFALLELYRNTRHETTRRVIDQWRENLVSKAVDVNGDVAERWCPGSGSAAPAGLQHSHSVIEVLVDIAQALKDSAALALAEKMAELWLERRGTTGLVPESEEDRRALLDPQVDLAIDLFKLSELTGRGEYWAAGLELLETVMERFQLPFGYAWAVDSETGRCVESQIETKYLGLLIKGMVVASQVADGKRIFRDEVLRNLARDR